jgi:hypothetical protein
VDYQKVFNENIVGSQIDNSHAWPFPPSSEKVGVDGRNDCLLLVIQRSYVREEKNPGEYVTGESIVTLLAFGVVGSVYINNLSDTHIRLSIEHPIILPFRKTINPIRNTTTHQNPRK